MFSRYKVEYLIGYTISYYNKTMEERRIIWDEAKNEKNKQNHDGLGFETAHMCLWILNEFGGLTGAKIIHRAKNAGRLLGKSVSSSLLSTRKKRAPE
jgi:uncharacterized DUF497 family protein